MNESKNQDEHAELERIIAQQPLRRPGVSLDERMAALLGHEAAEADRTHQSHRWVGSLWWSRAMLAAAMLVLVALVALMMLANRNADPAREGSVVVKPEARHEVQPVAGRFNPVRIEETWSNVEPDGVLVVDGDPLRRYQREILEHVQLFDEKNNIRIEYTVPRREMIVMPVKYD